MYPSEQTPRNARRPLPKTYVAARSVYCFGTASHQWVKVGSELVRRVLK
jgi:hypothetical protein